MIDEMCKLHVKLRPEPRTCPDLGSGGPAVESLWAEALAPATDRTPGRVRIQNSPFYTNEIAMGDVVECDAEGNYIRVVEPGGFWTVQGIAEANEYADGREACISMKRYFRDCGIDSETDWRSSNPREWIFSLAVPYEVDRDQLQDIAAGAPVTIVGLYCGDN